MKETRFIPILLLLCLAFSACEKKEGSTPRSAHPSLSKASQGGEKPVVYQMLVRLFGNQATNNKTYGTREVNGVGKFNDITETALSELRKMGVTHVWYTGVLEHATMTDHSADSIPPDDADVIKGRAGSPYAIKDYYDVAPDLAVDPSNRIAEFEALIGRTHAKGMKVLIDFVPNHVSRLYHSDAKPEGVVNLGENDDPSQAFSTQNNFYYLPETQFVVPAEHDPLGSAQKAPGEDGKFDESPAKVTGNNVFSHQPSVNDWFETSKLNYGVDHSNGEVQHFDPIPPTWTQIREILLYWLQKGVDGFRCDVAEMVPVEFWAWLIPEVKTRFPEAVFIAEVYNPAMYSDFVNEGKFDYLYDKVGVYDTIRELMSGAGSTAKIAGALAQSKGIEDHMLRFLENHDEQRIASPDFAGDPWRAVPGMTVSATMGKGPVMIYFGQEHGEPGKGNEGFQKEDGRTTIFDYWGVPEHQKWMNGGRFDGGRLSADQKMLRQFYNDLLYICRYDEAINNGDFLPLPIRNEKVYSFLRFTNVHHLLIVASFEPTDTIRMGLQIPGPIWDSMDLNSNVGYVLMDMLNTPTEIEFDAARAQSESGIPVVLPPMSAFVFEIESR